MSDESEQPVEDAGEGDRAWRERMQEQEPPPSELEPPTPRGIDPDDNRHP